MGGRWRVAAVAAGALLPGAAGAQQNFPVKPIRFVVPFLPGGAGDIFARVVAAKMSEGFGQQVVVENRPGANGIIGSEFVAKAPPDGYTIIMGNSAPYVFNPALYRKLPYDPVKDFAPVTQGTHYGYVLIVHPSLPVRTVNELVALSRQRPGQMQFGSTGAGGANHIAGEMLNRLAGVKVTHVPYKGSAGALADVLGGQITMMFDTPITTIPMLKGGKVRALAWSATRRSPHFPGVPTMEEAGYTGFEVTSWQAILTTGGTPRPIVDRLYQEAAKALRMPDVIDRLATQGGNEIVASTPDEFAATIKRELAFYAKFIRDAGITVEQP